MTTVIMMFVTISMLPARLGLIWTSQTMLVSQQKLKVFQSVQSSIKLRLVQGTPLETPSQGKWVPNPSVELLGQLMK